MPYRNPERRRAYMKDYHRRYHELHYESTNKRNRDNHHKNMQNPEYKERRRVTSISWRQNHPEQQDRRRMMRTALRRFIIAYYTDGKNCCECCGEREYLFLNIDHVNNDGGKHRKILNGIRLCEWLRTNDFPDGFQILCFNCNLAKGFFGKCPHQLGKVDETI